MEIIIGFIHIISIITLVFSNNVAAIYPHYNAIYQFGDSISDTGNMFHEIGRVGCARPPYGESAFRHPTGRCSDGLIMVDHIARAFKLPLVNPYLDRSANFSNGANFAIVGAQAISSLPEQLKWFKAQLATVCSNPTECKGRLKNSLIIMGGIGGNDYGAAAAQGKSMQDMYNLVPKVIDVITTTTKAVIELGATRLIVPGNFPTGCQPICMNGVDKNNKAGLDEHGCLKSWNDLSAFHNTKLQGAIASIKKQYPDVKIVYGDYYNALIELFKNAGSLGFDQNALFEQCCNGCGSPNGVACPNPGARVSWDGIHMTEHAYHFVANRLLKQISTL